MVLNGQTLESFFGLCSDHGCAVVAEQCAREATFLKPLAEAVNEAFSIFVA